MAQRPSDCFTGFVELLKPFIDGSPDRRFSTDEFNGQLHEGWFVAHLTMVTPPYGSHHNRAAHRRACFQPNPVSRSVMLMRPVSNPQPAGAVAGWTLVTPW